MQDSNRRSALRALALLFLTIQLVTYAGTGPPEVQAKSIIKIGILEEPRTLNIWLASDSWSRKVLSQIYQPLYIREPRNLKLIPWLAETEPVYDKDALSYSITLRAARWSDGTPVSAEDVVFTADVIKEFKIPRYYSNWRFVKSVDKLHERAVRIFLMKPEAIFLSRTLSTPIVQKKQWEKVVEEARRAEKPLAKLIGFEVERPVGTGPFLLEEWRRGAYLFLAKNKHFFGRGKEIEGYLLGPRIDGMILKMFGTPDAAVLAMRKGSVDMFWWGIQPGYLQDLLKDQNIRIFSNEKSALYYLGFNLRKKPFNDIHFRHAVATLVDKDFIMRRILQGYAIKMDSIVPPGNTFWHCPDLPTYGEGLSREDRIRRAYDILSKVGYRWKVPPVTADGEVIKGKGIILPEGEPMEKLTILTPPADYDPLRAMVGIMVQEWLKMAGIPATSRPMALGSLIHHVKSRHQFDLFVLGYGQLSLDPEYLRNFFHSDNDRPRGWNMSGYRNPDYDKIAEASSSTMNVEKRRELICKMQQIIIRDLPYLPLYNPSLIEAIRAEKFEGWVEMLGGIGNMWSFCTIRPK